MRKIITVEEHYEFSNAQPAAPKSDAKVNTKGNNPDEVTKLLNDFDSKIAYMDRYGISMQVLSNPTATTAMLTDRVEAVKAATKNNNELAKRISMHPDRFAGLAALPMADPEAAAAELERDVTQLGLKGAMIGGVPFGHFLDEPQYLPIFAEAEKLNVPIYLHPGMPSKAERDLLYKSPSYSDQMAGMLGSAGWGWHSEQGVQMIRLIASGLFDHYPKLQLISGHWGEMVPNFLERLDEFIGMIHAPLDRKFSEYYRNNVYVTASGMFTKPQMDLAVAEMTPTHVLWAEDFPYMQRKDQVAGFLEASDLDENSKEQVAHLNSEQLFHLN